MLKLTIFEFLFRTIPEMFLLVFGMCVLCNVKIERNKFICSSVTLGVLEFLVRRLPINYGVHTILNIIIMIILIKIFYSTDIIASIRAGLIITIILFICEAINMLMLNLIFKNNLQQIISNEITKTICGTPSLIFYMLVIVFIKNSKKRKRYADNK